MTFIILSTLASSIPYQQIKNFFSFGHIHKCCNLVVELLFKYCLLSTHLMCHHLSVAVTTEGGNEANERQINFIKYLKHFLLYNLIGYLSEVLFFLSNCGYSHFSICGFAQNSINFHSFSVGKLNWLVEKWLIELVCSPAAGGGFVIHHWGQPSLLQLNQSMVRDLSPLSFYALVGAQSYIPINSRMNKVSRNLSLVVWWKN